VGERSDACRDDDGRVVLIPEREVATCDACSSDEYCLERDTASSCRVLPPECDTTPTCACFLGSRGRALRYECSSREGRLVTRLLRPM